MVNVAEIKKINYQRAFFFKNLGYLFVDCAFAWYKRRDFLAVYQDGMLGQYIGDRAAAEAAEAGKLLFSDAEKFDDFAAGFRKTIGKTETYLTKAKTADTVAVEDLAELRTLTNEMFSYFEKTEFFFTDSSYGEEISDTLKRNLFTLGDDLKVKARPLLVELLTTVPYRFADIVANRNDINSEDLKSYTFDEIADLIKTGHPVPAAIIAERKISFVVFSENGLLIPLEGKDKEIVLARFKEENHAGKTEFKGTIANKGKVTAKARVVLPELDQAYELFVKKLLSLEMEQGEILVTETTSPDFVPLMKKAGGVIANQGGMNSHAAIMSRELKVPCLVGTKIATDVLKTGDLIELDADNGIVRIIKKA